jgi:hypothetical protein
MRGIKFVFLVAVAMAGLTLSTGVGASTGKGSAPSANRVGAHIRNVVINGSAQSNGRIPARLTRLLKTAASNPYCPGATVSTTPAGTQSCLWPTGYSGQVTCLQSSNSATVVQMCDASQIQTIANRNNTAIILQVIISQNPPSAQDGTQIVKLRQTALGTGSNSAGIGQYIKQSLGPGTPEDTEESDTEPDAPATATTSQKQESHQTVHLSQISEQGSNNAPVLQFLRQRERKAHADTTNQDQNVDLASLHPASVCQRDPSDALPPTVVVDANANQCILSNQTSTGSGKQNLWLTGDYNQLQRARKAGHGHQVQGIPFTGGSDYGLIQDSGGVSNVLTIQNERQVQRGIQVGISAEFVQSQNGPRKGSGSAQVGNPKDTWTGRQTSTQIQTRTPLLSFMRVADGPSNGQTNILVYSAQQADGGTMDVKQTASQNGGTPTTNMCSSSPCEIAIVCAAGEEGGCTPTTNCTDGQVIDPTTGECTSPCVVFPSTCDYYVTSIPPSSLYQRNLYTQRR